MSKQVIFFALVLVLALGSAVSQADAQVAGEPATTSTVVVASPLPPAFNAAPFADTFCTTGAEVVHGRVPQR